MGRLPPGAAAQNKRSSEISFFEWVEAFDDDVDGVRSSNILSISFKQSLTAGGT